MVDLPIPEAVATDPDAREILWAWTARKGLHCALLPELWEDPACWGIALADVIRHIAHGLAEAGKDEADTIRRKLSGLRAELNFPTDEPKGGYMQ